MLSYGVSRSEPRLNYPPPRSPDLSRILEQHVSAGFPPDLALDLVLNELVVQAADATRANAAALALARDGRMVCRAATGLHAPDLGIPLDTRDGLSGACVRLRASQLCADTECDPRIDPAISRHLGIRSMVVAPVFEEEPAGNNGGKTLIGVLEVFSPHPDAFSEAAQDALEEFARECARIYRFAAHAEPPAAPAALSEMKADIEEDDLDSELPAVAGPEQPKPEQQEEDAPVSALAKLTLPDSQADINAMSPQAELSSLPHYAPDSEPPAQTSYFPYHAWTLVLAALVILAAAGVSFLVGSRFGWLTPSRARTVASSQAAEGASANASMNTTSPAPVSNKPVLSGNSAKSRSAPTSSPSRPASGTNNDAQPSGRDELVVYDKGKVIFRMQPAQVAARTSPESRNAATVPEDNSVWLAPAQAESRLLSRIEPQLPPEAAAAHPSGSVVLEVRIAEDGTVSSIRILSGDPSLAALAADAVRQWRYEPYRVNGKPSSFQTDVTVTFSPSN